MVSRLARLFRNNDMKNWLKRMWSPETHADAWEASGLVMAVSVVAIVVIVFLVASMGVR